YRENMNAFTRYYVEYHTNAQLGVIKAWLDGGMKESPEEMACNVVQIMFLVPGESIDMHRSRGANIADTNAGDRRRAAIG
ncbi:MAG: TetR-like C-terminal domain-containing protein, partial [Coriobacteriales bacterium]